MDKNTLIILLAGVVVLLSWNGNKNDKIPRTRSTVLRHRYRLTASMRETLRCQYKPHGRMLFVRPGVEVWQLIDERMVELQRNPQSLQRLIRQAGVNGWSDYETIYYEAIQTLMIDGSIEKADEDECIMKPVIEPDTPTEPEVEPETEEITTN